jgi:hypothetical protein
MKQKFSNMKQETNINILSYCVRVWALRIQRFIIGLGDPHLLWISGMSDPHFNQ